MAARALLLKLELRGLIGLPARRCPSTNHLRNRDMPVTAVAGELIGGSLGDLQPLSATLVEPRSDVMVLFNSLLSCFHYLGHRNTVGENLRYLVRDRQERPVATGRPSTLIPCMRWKPLWTARASRAHATGPPTGDGWARLAAARATISSGTSTLPSKTCISTRLPRTSGKRCAHVDAGSGPGHLPVEEIIRKLAGAEPVIGFDETGVRAIGSLHWLHTASTRLLTSFFAHKRRGGVAMDEAGILPGYQGVAVHDFWKSYLDYDCRHALCNAHLLRELLPHPRLRLHRPQERRQCVGLPTASLPRKTLRADGQLRMTFDLTTGAGVSPFTLR